MTIESKLCITPLAKTLLIYNHPQS